MTHFYNKLTWGNWMVAAALLLCALTAGHLTCASYAASAEIFVLPGLGPSFSIQPASKGARSFMKDAQMGYMEEPGYMRVGDQWFRVHWYFNEKRVWFVRVFSPPVHKDKGSCTVEFLKGTTDDEE